MTLQSRVSLFNLRRFFQSLKILITSNISRDFDIQLQLHEREVELVDDEGLKEIKLMMTHVRLAMILPICLFSLPYQVLSGFGFQVNAGECLEHGEFTVERNLLKLHGDRSNLEKPQKCSRHEFRYFPFARLKMEISSPSRRPRKIVVDDELNGISTFYPSQKDFLQHFFLSLLF